MFLEGASDGLCTVLFFLDMSIICGELLEREEPAAPNSALGPGSSARSIPGDWRHVLRSAQGRECEI